MKYADIGLHSHSSCPSPQESRQLLVEAVRRDEMGQVEKTIDFEDMPDDDDNIDELLEYERWKASLGRWWRE